MSVKNQTINSYMHDFCHLSVVKTSLSERYIEYIVIRVIRCQYLFEH
jgi:hypothetical protein